MALEVGIRQEQGRRPYQEDEVMIAIDRSAEEATKGNNIGLKISSGSNSNSNNSNIELCTHVVGIFDGHAGGRCSKFVASNIHEVLTNSKSFSTNLKTAFIDAYETVNEKFLMVADKSGLNDGSTGLCFALRGGVVTVANVGDCRILVVGNKKVEQLSNDHKPNNRNEHSRIVALGGTVINCLGVPRVNGILAVSRAFGNRHLRDVIRPDPELSERELTANDKYIIIASDGVWDVLKNSDVYRISWKYGGKAPLSCQSIANEVVHTALMMGSQDNVTCVVIDIADYFTSLTNHRKMNLIHQRINNSISPINTNRFESIPSPQQTPSSYVDRPIKRAFSSSNESSPSISTIPQLIPRTSPTPYPLRPTTSEGTIFSRSNVTNASHSPLWNTRHIGSMNLDLEMTGMRSNLASTSSPIITNNIRARSAAPFQKRPKLLKLTQFK